MRPPARRSAHAARGADARPVVSSPCIVGTRSTRVACRAGASPKNTVEAMAPTTRNTNTRQSAVGAVKVEQTHELGDLRRERGDHRIERAVQKQPRDDNAADRRRERQHQTLREELPDDAPARRAKRQPDADLPLARDAACEQQVGDVGAADHQDQPEGEEQRSEDHAEPIARQRALARRQRGPDRTPGGRLEARLVPLPTPRRRRPLPPAQAPGFSRPMTSIGIVSSPVRRGTARPAQVVPSSREV